MIGNNIKELGMNSSHPPDIIFKMVIIGEVGIA